MAKILDRLSLKGRTALITGGAGHIGSAIADAFAEIGCAVALADINPDACQKVCDRLSGAYGGKAVPLDVDLTDEASTRALVGRTVAACGGLDIIVHAAAFVGTTNLKGWSAPFEEQTVEAWDKAMRINLTSAFALAQTAKPVLDKSPGASIIFVGSIYGQVAPDMSLYEGTSMSNPAGYGASKGGLLQLNRYLASVLAPSIRVNMVSPGGVLRGQPESFQRKYVDKTPLRAMATEDDITGAAVYLATDLSRYVTGLNLVVDGGWTIL